MKSRVLTVLLTGLLCSLPTLAAPKRVAKPIAGYAWQPDKTLLNRLAAPVVVGGYELRPPLGYRLQRQSAPDQGQVLAWVGPARVDGVRPYLMLGIINVPTGEANKYTLEQALDKLLGSIQRLRKQDWQRTRAERGTINGLTFVRASWSGTASGMPFKMHGFSYVTQVGNQVIQLSSQDVEPHDKAALALAQTAALTFKRATHPAPPDDDDGVRILN